MSKVPRPPHALRIGGREIFPFKAWELESKYRSFLPIVVMILTLFLGQDLHNCRMIGVKVFSGRFQHLVGSNLRYSLDEFRIVIIAEPVQIVQCDIIGSCPWALERYLPSPDHIAY